MPLSMQEVLSRNVALGRGFGREGRVRPFTSSEFLDISIEMGWTQLFPPYRAVHENLARWVHEALQVKSTLEIGSGPGYLLNCLADLGIDARGLDGNEESRAFFAAQHPHHAHRYALDALFTGQYPSVDAVLAIEVFEHIPDDGLDNILRRLRDEIKPRYIVFSSTPYDDPNPGWDAQWGHINIKQPAEWDALFARYGFTESVDQKPPVTAWAKLYANTLDHAKPKPLLSYRFSLQGA